MSQELQAAQRMSSRFRAARRLNKRPAARVIPTFSRGFRPTRKAKTMSSRRLSKPFAAALLLTFPPAPRDLHAAVQEDGRERSFDRHPASASTEATALFDNLKLIPGPGGRAEDLYFIGSALKRVPPGRQTKARLFSV